MDVISIAGGCGATEVQGPPTPFPDIMTVLFPPDIFHRGLSPRCNSHPVAPSQLSSMFFTTFADPLNPVLARSKPPPSQMSHFRRRKEPILACQSWTAAGLVVFPAMWFGSVIPVLGHVPRV